MGAFSQRIALVCASIICFHISMHQHCIHHGIDYCTEPHSLCVLISLALFLQQLQTLTATVVYHPWYTPVYEIVSIEAAEAGTQYSRKVGAPETLKDLHDSYVVGAAEVAVTELNRRSNSLYKLVLIEVLHGTSQVRRQAYMCLWS